MGVLKISLRRPWVHKVFFYMRQMDMSEAMYEENKNGGNHGLLEEKGNHSQVTQ